SWSMTRRPGRTRPRSRLRWTPPPAAEVTSRGVLRRLLTRSTPRTLLGELPAEVGALVGVGFMVALGYGLVAPALPLFARQFGVGKAAAGAVVSAFALMRLLMAPFVGRLVNTFGERVLLATGIGVVAVSSLFAGLAQSYWQ